MNSLRFYICNFLSIQISILSNLDRTVSNRQNQKHYEKIIPDEAKSNPKTFWQYINIRTKTTSGIANLETPQEILTSNDEEKAEILADFFTSVFTQETLDDIPEVQNKILEDELQEHKI